MDDIFTEIKSWSNYSAVCSASAGFIAGVLELSRTSCFKNITADTTKVEKPAL